MRKIVIAILLFSILFLGSINLIPGISIRNIAIVCLFLYLVVHYRKISFDIAEKSYLFFVVVLLLCSILNGNIASFDFARTFISYHLACLVIIASLPVIIKSSSDIFFVTKILFVFFIVNVFATYLQFINAPIGWDIADIITPGFVNTVNEEFGYLDILDDLTSYALAPGINGFVVTNGYFVASFLPIAAQKFVSNNIKDICVGFVLIGIGIVGLYMIQQRAAFFLGILCVLIMFSFRAKRDWLITPTLGIILLFILYPYLDTIDMGRLVYEDIAMDNRTHLLDFFFAYFDEEKFWLGGETYDYWVGTLGHNTIFNALLQGGIVTMLVYVIVLIITSFQCVKALYKSVKNNEMYAFVYALSCCMFIGVSLTHSMGIQSGAVMFWIPYILMKLSTKYMPHNMTV